MYAICKGVSTLAGRRTSGALDMLLLSILSNGDSFSGYEIAGILAEPIALVWAVKHSQIYPALALLEERGDIIGDWVVQSGRPNKKTYVISPAGLERLCAWLCEPRTALSQDEVRLIVYNLNLVGRKVVDDALATYRKQCVEAKRQLEERWARGRKLPWAEHADSERMIGIRSVYEHALAVSDAQIVWCDEGLARAAEAVEQDEQRSSMVE